MKNFLLIFILLILGEYVWLYLQQRNEIEDLKFHIFVLGQQKKLENCSHTRILQMYEDTQTQLTEELYNERKKHHPATADRCEVEWGAMDLMAPTTPWPDCF